MTNDFYSRILGGPCLDNPRRAIRRRVVGDDEGKVAVALFDDGRKCPLDVCLSIVDRHADRNPDAGSIWSALQRPNRVLFWHLPSCILLTATGIIDDEQH